MVYIIAILLFTAMLGALAFVRVHMLPSNPIDQRSPMVRTFPGYSAIKLQLCPVERRAL